MRVAFIGGTHHVGSATVPLLLAAGHEVAVAHTGTHEHPAVAAADHLHGERSQLLGEQGPVERWRPDALIDTFAGGATSAKARQLAACAARAGVRRTVAVSSMDVYQHVVHAGVADGSGVIALPSQPLPIRETDELRTAPYPGATDGHDNLAAEAQLHRAGSVVALRPGAIYGPFAGTREWFFVKRIHDGAHDLPFPVRGQQFFHRVSVDRVANAVLASLTHAPDGFWPCNVVDPYDWTYAGLAAQVARILSWHWKPVNVPLEDSEHPWSVAHPIYGDDRRLRDVLGVASDQPEPTIALQETLEWLWQNRHDLNLSPVQK